MSPSAVPTTGILDETENIPLSNGTVHQVDGVKKIVESDEYTMFRSTFEILEEPIHTRRPLKVLCLGAGYSGILLGIIWNQRMRGRNADLVIYERNSDLGGTWLENRYPGCQCDIPAHNYAYSFEPNFEWPNYYATSKHIYDYLKRTAEKYDVERYIQYGHTVESATWNEDEGKWHVRISSGGQVAEEVYDVFINAGGILNNWKWPDIDGVHEFQGKLLHSANYDESYNLEGQRVAVIGNGSSGIQIVSKVAKVASHLTTFIRSHCWISPAPGVNEPTDEDPKVDEHYNYAPEVIEQFKSDPKACQSHCRALMNRRLVNFRRTHAASDCQKQAQELFTSSMRQRLGNSQKGKALLEMLLPKFPVGCRRQTPGPGYLEALLQDNVDTRWDDLGKFTKKGILTKSGELIELDAIICATGFDTTFKPRFPLKGRGGVDLAERWEREDPKAYFGITTPDFPNYFTFIGPSSPISNGSLVQGIQAMGIYIWKCIDKIQTERIKSMDIAHGATNDYFEYVQTFLQRTVWVGGCRSWYKRGTVDGPVVAIYGGTSFHYVEALRNPRWEDYNYKLLGETERENMKPNRFEYLGNGFTLREETGGNVGDTQTLSFDEFWDLFVLKDLYH